jgi:hypothetical protein
MSPRLMESSLRVRRPIIASVVATLTARPAFAHTERKPASPCGEAGLSLRIRLSYCDTDLRRMTGLN